jgi:hypothetical protein
MADTFTNDEKAFTQEEKDELGTYGFTDEQIVHLETLDIDHEDKFSNICKQMDDFGFTPEELIEIIDGEYNAEPEPESSDEELSEEEESDDESKSQASQGGKRRTRRRKQNKSKRRKSIKRKGKSRKQSKGKRRKQSKGKTRRRK